MLHVCSKIEEYHGLKEILPAAVIVLLLPLLVGPAAACSLASCLNQGIEVRGKVIVMVIHEGKPLQGAKVEITTGTRRL